MSLVNYILRRFRGNKDYIRKHIVISILLAMTSFMEFYRDIDNYNEGYSLSLMSGELSIIGINIVIILLGSIIFNLEEKKIKEKIKILKDISVEKLNFITNLIIIYNIYIYIGITQNINFGINPLHKSYQEGFWIFILLLALCTYESYKANK